VKRSTNCSQSTVIAAAEAIQSLFQLRDATGVEPVEPRGATRCTN
jgi:hypothetical protein